MGSPLGLTGTHRQERLRSIECLDLRLLVDGEHERLLRRVQIEPDPVPHLLDEQGIGRELEGLAAVGLQHKGSPDA